MSTATLRYYDMTLGFVPFRQERELERSLNRLRLRVSRRRFKQAVREMLSRMDYARDVR